MYGITISIGLPNYGLAIIFMTIAIKLVLFPITQKQMKSMRAMQEMQPKLKYIQDKYKDDPQKMQAKVMELYKEHGANPFSGCLPLLIQMPIFIAFYQSLYGFEFKVAEHAAFLGIPNIGETVWYFTTHGAPIAIYLPIIAGLTTYLQQKVSMVNTTDPTQKSMLYMMPIFMAWIAFTLPAGLPLYWIMFNILGIAQQLYVNWSSNKAKLDTGAGITVEAEAKAFNKNSEEKKNTKEEEIGRDKGGKKNGTPNNRKKRKKR